jgi:UDP-N-acetylglucosamine enolpyruvyl transferase
MKTVQLILLAVFTFLLFFAGCIVNISVDQNSVSPADPAVIKLISVALLAAYEVVVRLIPSVGDYSMVSWIIKILKKVSDNLNNSKV